MRRIDCAARAVAKEKKRQDEDENVSGRPVSRYSGKTKGRGKGRTSEQRRSERDNLPTPPLTRHHPDPTQTQYRDGPQFTESLLPLQPRPGPPIRPQSSIDQEQRQLEVHGERGRERCATEAELDGRDGPPDEQPVEEDVDRSNDEDDDGRDVHETLGLEVFLADRVAGCEMGKKERSIMSAGEDTGAGR